MTIEISAFTGSGFIDFWIDLRQTKRPIRNRTSAIFPESILLTPQAKLDKLCPKLCEEPNE
jgi:hypothetical protein